MSLTSSYALQAIRLSALRYSDDSVTPRIISLDPSFALNPYVAAAGLSDIDRWPEITRALDSPPPDLGYSSTDSDGGVGRAGPSRSAGGLSYTQTIMGNKSGGLGMRVAGRRTGGNRDKRTNSSSVVTNYAGAGAGAGPTQQGQTPRRSPMQTPRAVPGIDVFSPNGSATGRPRSDSAPAIALLGRSAAPRLDVGSMLASGRGLGGAEVATGNAGVLEQAMSMSEMSTTEDGFGEGEGEGDGVSEPRIGSSMLGAPGTGLGESARPSESITPDGLGLGETLLDDDDLELGSDLDEDPGEDEDMPPIAAEDDKRRSMLLASQRSSYITDLPPLQFTHEPIPASQSSSQPTTSALTAALHKHVPHLVSTANAPGDENDHDASNPFASLYASVEAHPPQPSLSLDLYFPHSAKPTLPLVVVVRKDATVEEVTGYGLYKFWEEAREPLLNEEEGDEQRWSTVGWGLRIVEDDGEVDEDFPRKSQIDWSCGAFCLLYVVGAAANSRIKHSIVMARSLVSPMASLRSSKPPNRRVSLFSSRSYRSTVAGLDCCPC